MKKITSILLALVLLMPFGAFAGTASKVPYGLNIGQISSCDTPPADFGMVCVKDNTGTMTLYFKDDAGTETNLLTVGTGNTLDTAYDQGGAGAGKAVTVDSGAIALTNNAANNNGLLTVEKSPVGAQSGDLVTITAGANASGDLIQFANTGTGNDLAGTGATWSVSKAGAGSFASVTATTLNAGTIYQPSITAAAAGNQNLTIDAAGNGTITFGNTSTGAFTFVRDASFNGNTTLGNAATDTITVTGIVNSNLTLDDGVTDSPSLIFKDATDETATIKKADGGNITVTPNAATQSLQVLTGNLRVGNGVPGTAAMDGEDAYIEGQLEVDGAVQLDGAVTAASTLDVTGAAGFAGTVTLDDGAGASPSLIFKDATDETATFSKADAGYLSITTVAGDGVSVLTGNFKVGGGAPDVALDGEDAYVTGTLEIDGAARFDGAVTLGNATADDITITGYIAADVIFKNGLTGGADLSVAAGAADTAGSTFDLVSGAGGTPSTDQVGKNGGALTLTGGAGSAKNGAGATDGDGGDVVLTGGAKGGATAGTEVTGIVRVGNPTVGSAKTADLLAVAGGLEVDGNAKFDGNITGDGATVFSGFLYSVTDSGAGPDTLTAADCGKTFYNSQANQTNLPEASTAIGCTLTFVVTNASNYDINPDDADIILGATDAAGDMIRSGTVGDSVTLRAISASQWAVVSMYPAATDWADAN